MNVIIRALFLIACIGQSAAFAHGGHNEISSETALNIASKSVQQFTFKDFGYQVGKLDASWKSAKDANFNVVEATENAFIVSSTNSSSNKTIYFEIAKNGKILSVKGTK